MQYDNTVDLSSGPKQNRFLKLSLLKDGESIRLQFISGEIIPADKSAFGKRQYEFRVKTERDGEKTFDCDTDSALGKSMAYEQVAEGDIFVITKDSYMNKKTHRQTNSYDVTVEKRANPQPETKAAVPLDETEPLIEGLDDIPVAF